MSSNHKEAHKKKSHEEINNKNNNCHRNWMFFSSTNRTANMYFNIIATALIIFIITASSFSFMQSIGVSSSSSGVKGQTGTIIASAHAATSVTLPIVAKNTVSNNNISIPSINPTTINAVATSSKPSSSPSSLTSQTGPQISLNADFMTCCYGFYR